MKKGNDTRMSEKWMEEDEFIVLEGRIWASFTTPLGPGNSVSRVYLTDRRLYGKDSWTRLKMFDLPLSDIKNLKKRNKYLRIEAEIKGKKKRIDLRLKDMVDDWEWMIKERINSLKR
jgi:hypothetical protein